MASYIRKRGISGSDGRQLNIDIDSLKRTKGTPPSRVNIPGISAENQISAPIIGQQDGQDVVIRLTEQSSNVGFDVTSGGSTSAHSPEILTIIDQYNFLYDEVITNDITASYELFIEWNGLVFRGTLLASDQLVSGLVFGQEILITLTLDRGINPFYEALV